MRRKELLFDEGAPPDGTGHCMAKIKSYTENKVVHRYVWLYWLLGTSVRKHKALVDCAKQVLVAQEQ
jgi:hypothetical protein